MELPKSDPGRAESSGESSAKKKPRKKSTETKKKKSSPILKVYEETLVNGIISDNATDIHEELENDNFDGVEDSLLTHYVLSKILDRKKLELLESEEVINFIRAKSVKE